MGSKRDKRVHIRTSERRALKQCPQKWWWAWREGLSAREPAKALWFGTGIHLALAHYFKPGKKRAMDYIEVWREFAHEEAEFIRTKSSFGADEDQLVDARILGETMLNGHHAHYGGSKNWDVIATEQDFQLLIPFASDDDEVTKEFRAWVMREYGKEFEYDGTFDGLYRDTDTKKIWLMEHKTAGTISTGHLVLDDQAGSYWAVAASILRDSGVLKPRENIAGIMYNYLRKAMPDERPVNPDGYRTNKPKKEHYMAAFADADIVIPGRGATLAVMEEKAQEAGLTIYGDVSSRQPAPLFERVPVKRTPAERRTQLDRIRDEVNVNMAYRSGMLPIIKTPSDRCQYGCQFFEMCQLHEQGANWEDFRDSVYRVQDPYADHRKSA